MKIPARLSLTQEFQTHYQRTIAWSIILFVVVLGVTISAVLFTYQRLLASADRVSRLNFDNNVRSVIDRFSQNLIDYESALRAVRGFVISSQSVEEYEWNEFIQNLNLHTDYPGFVTINYGPVVAATASTAFETGVRVDPALTSKEYRTYRIYPQSDHQILIPVIFIAPFQGHEYLLGFDMMSEPSQQIAVSSAIDTGEIFSTGVISVGSPPASGFAIFFPIYRPNMPLTTLAQRRNAVRGIVSAWFSLQNSFAELFSVAPPFDRLDIHLYNQPLGEVPDPVELLYDSKPEIIRSADEFIDSAGGWHKAVEVNLVGTPWTIHVWGQRSNEFAASTGLTPQLFLGGGLVLSLLLSTLVATLVYSRMMAYRLALKLTAELEDSRRSIALLIRNLHGAVFRRANDTEMTFLFVSAGIAGLTGYTPADFASGRIKFGSLVLPQDYQRIQTTFRAAIDQRKSYSVDFRIKDKDSQLKWLRGSGQPVYDFQGTFKYLDGFYVDITDQKGVEAQLAGKVKELEKLNVLLVGREKKMIELKQLLNTIQAKDGTTTG